MGKILFGLIGLFCLSGFLIADPERLLKVTEKEVMSFCAIKFKQENPSDLLTIDNLISDKPKLVRQISDIANNVKNISLGLNEKALIKLLIDEYCPVKSPKPISKKLCPVISPTKKQRKLLVDSVSSSSAQTPVQIYTHHEDIVDCGVPATTPPPSPVKTKRAIQQVNTLHRQWTSKWKSDGDLQSMLQESFNSNSTASRKRTNSN